LKKEISLSTQKVGKKAFTRPHELLMA